MDVDLLVSDLDLFEPEFHAAQTALNKIKSNEKGGQAKRDKLSGFCARVVPDTRYTSFSQRVWVFTCKYPTPNT